MTEANKRQIVKTILIVGIIGVMMVMMSAYASALRTENNQLISDNKALKGEVKNMEFRIQTATSLDHIEKVASKELGMVYPKSTDCVYLTAKDKPKHNFATVIRKSAYN